MDRPSDYRCDSMPRVNKRTFSKIKQPFVKVLFSPRLGRPWLGGWGTTESMWVMKVAGGDLRGAGLLANQPFQLRYVRLGDVVLYASGHREAKPEALVIERPKFNCDLGAMSASQQPAWAAAARRASPQCRRLLKRLSSGEFKLTLSKMEALLQRILGCAICGFCDQLWMTTNEKWARVPR